MKIKTIKQTRKVYILIYKVTSEFKSRFNELSKQACRKDQ